MTHWRNECTSEESLPGGQIQATIGIKPRAHWALLPGGGRVLRAIASDWVQGDAELPHLVSESPIRVGTADSGRRRLYPVAGDLTRYIEIGAPMIKPAGSWVSVGFANATRQGNRITWSRPQANMSVTHAGHYIKLDIELLNGYVPPNRQFAFPASLVGLTRDGARILADGKPVMLMRPPVVYDAANPDDVRPIASTFGAIGGQTGVLFTLPSLAGMSRPVVDPTFSSQPAAAAGIDTAIWQANATTNYGALDSMSLRFSTSTNNRHALLRFSLTGIAGSISTAQLTGTRIDVDKGGPIALHRLLVTDWTEDGATWNTKDGATGWPGSAGANTAGTDYVAVAEDTQTVADPLGSTTTWNVVTAIRATLAAQSVNLLLRPGTGSVNDDPWLNLASSDHATEAYRPLLTVTYTLPTGGIGRGRSTLCRQGRNRWL